MVTINAHCSILDREDAILNLTPFDGSVPVIIELVDLTFEEAFDNDVLLFEKREQPLTWMFIRTAKECFAYTVAKFDKDYSVIGYEAVRQNNGETNEEDLLDPICCPQ